jgi:hypothetical protein
MRWDQRLIMHNIVNITKGKFLRSDIIWHWYVSLSLVEVNKERKELKKKTL